MACDICGKTGTRLEDLMGQYQTSDIKQICPECAVEVNRQLDKLKMVTHGMVKYWLKKFMGIKKKKSSRRDLPCTYLKVMV